MDSAQIQANITLEQALRRANLLAAAAKVSQNITRVMDLEELLPKTVDIICDAYNFYYAGVFLLNETGDFAVLRAGRGEPGRIMMANNHKLAVGGSSMIGACTALNEARISLDVDTEEVWYPNPVLPQTRSEMALPLAIGNRVMGALTVQSEEAAAFSDEDVSSLQAMANQLAIAIDNARQRAALEEAHAELLRAKTFEVIATATGDAIHWIGNKAEPIGGTVARLRQDVQLLVAGAAELLGQPQVAGEVKERPLARLILSEAGQLRHSQPELAAAIARLDSLPPPQLEQRLSLGSVLEDLEIIDDAARLIMKVKEELIGPAREQAPRPTMLEDVVQDALSGLSLPSRLTAVTLAPNLPLVLADPVQLNRVVVNLVKNAREASAGQPEPKVQLAIRPDSAGEFLELAVSDNGPGIAPADLDKIWITFHTSKGIKEHAGLGLPACRLILEQLGGAISAASQPGQGATFTVKLPIYQGPELKAKGEPGKGKILLIDDDDRWRHFAAAVLESAGYKITTSGKNYSAGNFAGYDLILVDDYLIEANPAELLWPIKMAGAVAKTVVVSSNPRVERTKERMLLGVHNVLPKPYTRPALLAAVKEARHAIR